MLFVELIQEFLDVKLATKARIQFANTNVDLCPKLLERLDSAQHFPPERFLRRLGKFRGLGNRKFKRFDHRSQLIIGAPRLRGTAACASLSPMVNRPLTSPSLW